MINKIKSIFQKEKIDYCLKVSQLNINYGSKKVLQDINFVVENKDIFGILGLSGSGKSTLLKAIMGFTNYSGYIRHSEKRVGYCPQDDAFIPELSIQENIKIFAYLNSTTTKTATERAIKLMKELDLNEPLNKTSDELSGGQKKRLNIILSILHEPKTIIMDEPFAGLDYKNRIILWRFIGELKSKGKTIIITTHLLEEAQDNCNKLLIISHGKKFAQGSISDLKRSLKFRHYIKIRFKYLNKENTEKIIDYCKKKGFKVIQLSDNTAGIGLPIEEEKENLLSVIKRMNIEYKIEELRQPSLNELFMVSIK